MCLLKKKKFKGMLELKWFFWVILEILEYFLNYEKLFLFL